jgi:tetratricopeptide (TPR) repeat protein
MGDHLKRISKENSNTSSEASSQGDIEDKLDFQKHDLYKKGISMMANEKLEDAIRSFELALRIDPKFVDAWIKKGYAHFHLEQASAAISCYDKALDIDFDNSEAWNLKGLAYYRTGNYDKALECCERAIDRNPSEGMSWYNKACYLTLKGKIDDGIEALKRAIEIDISFAKKAVSDRDFENARAEEGFRRIIEVVVLESIRQGYNHVGKIVWMTGMDKQDVQDAAKSLILKGLIIKREKKEIHGFFTSKEEYYELTRDIANRLGSTTRDGLFGVKKKVSAPIQELKDIIGILAKLRQGVESGDVNTTLEASDLLINPSKHGSTLVEQFFDEHRDLRLFQVRLKDKGQKYLNSHKSELLNLISEIDIKVRNSPVAKLTEN